MKKHLSPSIVLIYIALMASAATIISGIALNKRVDAVADIANNNRTSQIRNCEISKAPGGIRFIVADQINKQIKQSQTLDYHTFFPNIPKTELDKLIAQQIAQQKAEVSQLLSVDCASLYPKVTSP